MHRCASLFIQTSFLFKEAGIVLSRLEVMDKDIKPEQDEYCGDQVNGQSAEQEQLAHAEQHDKRPKCG